ncbi:MAG: BCAM0308 family protein [Burkholderiaceae bacterium]
MSGIKGLPRLRARGEHHMTESSPDPYKARDKLPEPTICGKCGVVYADGRWQWVTDAPERANRVLCPACERIRDKAPAGSLTLGGAFLAAHREEILNLVQNRVNEQNALHPMNRILGIDEQDDGEIVIGFTDVHLPPAIGRAIEQAYEGELTLPQTNEPEIVRVDWRR